jgi:transaldolase/glucose-6-phosphate isomerase
MAGNPPVDVQQYGQSIWYDNISRALINSGELQRLIDEDGVLGVTSNPTIFNKAIGGSGDYDAGLLAVIDGDTNSIYEALAIDDIQRALDLFRPIFERTNGLDGYVSLEVSPLLADDTASTITEAKRLYETVNRPNLMVKIPATPAGIPAIEEAIASGINVNVTLIFSVENYRQVMEAYIRGLERRAAAGEDVTKVRSVASFFLSRIDTAVDRILDSNIRAAQGRDVGRVALNNQLKGKAAIANAKVAYKGFLDTFYGERFAKLKESGAQVQRVLWASTGTKNPAYPDTLYLDNLIGPDSVNTVPPDTLKAFKDHGTAANTLGEGLDEAQKTLDMLAEAGVNLEQVTLQLQADGVESFVESFRELMDAVEAKRDVLKTGIIKNQDMALGIYEEAYQKAMKELASLDANRRIWAHDGGLWKDNESIIAKINDRLGWLDVRETIDLPRLKKLQAWVKGSEFKHIVLLGMGGSSLAPEVLSVTYGPQDGYPTLSMLDSTDPTYIKRLEDGVDLSKSLFIVASKSGGTIETAMFYQYFFDRTGGNGAQFIAITDPGSNMESIAREKGFRDIFLNPADIGGRYSALSYFGMVPAALLGLDLDKLWGSADQMMVASGPKIGAANHPGITLGAVIGALAKEGRDKVTIVCSPSIASFGNWAEQLIAESLGKEGKGVLPVVGATVGKPHDYSSDRLFIFLKLEGDDNDTLVTGIRALREAGHPRMTLRIHDKYDLGGEFFRWEFATAIAGKLLDINPFDEPNVTESKQATGRLLDIYQKEGKLPETAPLLTEDGVSLYVDERMSKTMHDLARQSNYDSNKLADLIATQLNATHAGDYFAINAYLPATPEVDAALQEARRRLRHVTHRAVTLGYGPRFLHSTGQLHKGGPNNGVFIQLTTDDPQDLPIPGAPYSFGTLKAAQAAGDMETLLNKGRRAMRLHFSGDIVIGIQKLVEAIELAGQRRQ